MTSNELFKLDDIIDYHDKPFSSDEIDLMRKLLNEFKDLEKIEYKYEQLCEEYDELYSTCKELIEKYNDREIKYESLIKYLRDNVEC